MADSISSGFFCAGVSGDIHLDAFWISHPKVLGIRESLRGCEYHPCGNAILYCRGTIWFVRSGGEKLISNCFLFGEFFLLFELDHERQVMHTALIDEDLDMVFAGFFKSAVVEPER